MFEFITIALTIVFVPCLLIVYRFGFRNGYVKAKKERNPYETLTETDIERINIWHKEYSYRISDPKNWDVIRKINKKVNKNMFFH
ncbi:hypothetical protein CVD28_02660 [Bacillus sp. M6-12]|uniref:hypothetical protein n=1 Tax=Bacillus sp. M6-12 TaxID=2054166 RepID=UPI000C76F656|nr:hypothetical protein [Bacillus sp. M6-12]PLS19334.1 hypothetical protein CVD28_02660 [Bacillus sp. M6-12]